MGRKFTRARNYMHTVFLSYLLHSLILLLQTIEVNLENFIAGGHVTDLSPILDSPGESDDNNTETKIVKDPPSPTREEIVAALKVRESELLIKLEKNRQEYEQIAQALMEVRRDLALNTPDEYDILSEEPAGTDTGDRGSSFIQPPREVILNEDQNPPEVPPPSPIEIQQAMRRALIRDAVRRYFLRRRSAALAREFIIQPPRVTRFIPVRRLTRPFRVRIYTRQIMPTTLPIVVDRRNPEIDTRPFEPIPRVTSVAVEDPEDDMNEPIEPTPIAIV